jgi:hypothetical protein
VGAAVRAPLLTWAVFHELYTNVTWGTLAYGWTLREEQVELYRDDRSIMLAVMTTGAYPLSRWGVWFEWCQQRGLGVNGLFGDEVPANTMMQVVPVRPVPSTRWEVVA